MNKARYIFPFLFKNHNKESVLKRAVSLINEDNPAESKKHLDQYIDHLNTDNLVFINDFYANYKHLKGSVSSSKEFSNYVKGILDNIDDKAYKFTHWLLLTKVFGSLGLLEISFYLREKSIASLLSNYKNGKNKILCAQAALEHGDLKLTKMLLGKPRLPFGRNPELRIFEDFFKYIDGISGGHEPLINSPLGNVVKGKSVNVIGPANYKPGILVSDPQSVTASVGYAGKESLPSNMDVRINISFYAHAKVKQIICSNEKTEQAKNVDCLIVKHKPDMKALLDSGFSSSQLVMRFDFKSLFYMTSPNAGPELVYNCLVGGAKNVNIFNTDFFLTKSYPTGYLANKALNNVSERGFEVDRIDSCRTFSCVHYPAAQIRFYRNLINSNLVKGDQNFNHIMAMPINNYFEKLDLLYGIGTWG